MFDKNSEPCPTPHADTVIYNTGAEYPSKVRNVLDYTVVRFDNNKNTGEYMVRKGMEGFYLYPSNENSQKVLEDLGYTLVIADPINKHGKLSEEDIQKISDVLGEESAAVETLKNSEENDDDEEEAFYISYFYFGTPNHHFLFTNSSVFLLMLEPRSFWISFLAFAESYYKNIVDLSIQEHPEYIYATNLFKTGLSVVGNLMQIDRTIYLSQISFDQTWFQITSNLSSEPIQNIVNKLCVVIGMHLDDLEFVCVNQFADEKGTNCYLIQLDSENFRDLEEIDTIAVSRSLLYSDYDPFDVDGDGDVYN